MSTKLDNTPMPGDRQAGQAPRPPFISQPEARITIAAVLTLAVVAYFVVFWAHGMMEIGATDYEKLTSMGRTNPTVNEQVMLLMEEKGYISNHTYKDILKRLDNGSLPALGAKMRMLLATYPVEVQRDKPTTIFPLPEEYIMLCRYFLALAAFLCIVNYHRKGMFYLAFVLAAGVIFFVVSPYMTEISPDRYMMLEHHSTRTPILERETHTLLHEQGYISLKQYHDLLLTAK